MAWLLHGIAWLMHSVAWPFHGVAWPLHGVVQPMHCVAWPLHGVAWPAYSLSLCAPTPPQLSKYIHPPSLVQAECESVWKTINATKLPEWCSQVFHALSNTGCLMHLDAWRSMAVVSSTICFVVVLLLGSGRHTPYHMMPKQHPPNANCDGIANHGLGQQPGCFCNFDAVAP